MDEGEEEHQDLEPHMYLVECGGKNEMRVCNIEFDWTFDVYATSNGWWILQVGERQMQTEKVESRSGSSSWKCWGGCKACVQHREKILKKDYTAGRQYSEGYLQKMFQESAIAMTQAEERCGRYEYFRRSRTTITCSDCTWRNKKKEETGHEPTTLHLRNLLRLMSNVKVAFNNKPTMVKELKVQ